LASEDGASVTDEEGAVEMFEELDAALSVGASVGPSGDLDPAVAESDGVVLGNDSSVLAGEVAFEIARSGPPGRSGVTWGDGEAPVEFGDEGGQVVARVLERDRLVKAQQAYEAILERAPEALDASFGLRASGGDVSDPEFP